MSSKVTKFEALLEAAPDAMVGVDVAGMILFVNRQTESVFGYERDDLVGQRLEMLVPESARQDHVARRAGYCAAPGIRTMGTELRPNGRRRDGSEFPVDIALSYMGSGGAMVVIAAVRDMTLVAEQQAREQERLRELEQFQRLTVGRELKMIELKKEIEYLRQFAPPEARGSDHER